MSLEQIVHTDLGHGRSHLYLKLDGEIVGKVEFEPLQPWPLTALHYSLYDDSLKRKGWMTLMVDAAFAQFAWNPEYLIFVDDPRYIPAGGCGGHTPEGAKFAKGYRKKRGLKRKRMTDRDYDALPQGVMDANWDARSKREDTKESFYRGHVTAKRRSDIRVGASR